MTVVSSNQILSRNWKGSFYASQTTNIYKLNPKKLLTCYIFLLSLGWSLKSKTMSWHVLATFFLYFSGQNPQDWAGQSSLFGRCRCAGGFGTILELGGVLHQQQVCRLCRYIIHVNVHLMTMSYSNSYYFVIITVMICYVYVCNMYLCTVMHFLFCSMKTIHGLLQVYTSSWPRHQMHMKRPLDVQVAVLVNIVETQRRWTSMVDDARFEDSLFMFVWYVLNML